MYNSVHARLKAQGAEPSTVDQENFAVKNNFMVETNCKNLTRENKTYVAMINE